MSRVMKLGAVVLVLIAIAVLLFVAASDRIFFIDQQLTPDTVVYTEEEGYAFLFYKDGTAVRVASVLHNVGAAEGNLVPVLFQLEPRDGYQIDSLRLELHPVQPAAALTLTDPENGSTPAYDCTRSDSGSTVILDFPDLGPQDPAIITLNFWLDRSLLDPATPDVLVLDIAFSMHEKSVFKIVKYSARIAIQLVIPSAG